MRGRGVVLVVPLIVAAGFGLGGCGPTLDLTVNTSVDGHDAVPGDGFCEETLGVGDCSLRAAVEEGNTSPKDVTIELPNEVWEIGSLGPLTVNGPSQVTIHGEGSVIDATGADTGIVVDGRLQIINAGVSAATTQDILVNGGASLGVTQAFVTDSATGLKGMPNSNIVSVLSGFDRNSQAGLDSAGTVALHYADVQANGHGVGAGLQFSGTATVSHSSIHENNAVGVLMTNGSVTIESSTIDHNESPLGCGDFTCSVALGPGGIFAKNGTMTLRNSTVAANTVTGLGLGGVLVGFVDNTQPFGVGTLTVEASTLVDAETHILVGSMSAAGSVFANCIPSSFTLPLTDRGGNIVTGFCPLPAAVLVSDAMLGPLTDNGGATKTALPLPGSPLIDHIPNGSPGVCDGSIPTDQRDVARPQGTACDTGAVEKS